MTASDQGPARRGTGWESRARQRRRVRGLLGLLLALTAVSAGGQAPDADVVATYRDGTVTAADLAGWSRYVELDRGSPSRLEVRGKVEEIVVLRALAARRADAAATEMVRARRRQLEQRCAERLLRRQLLAAAEPAEDDLRSEYERRLPELQQPARWRLQNLFEAVPKEAGPEIRAAARSRLEALRQRALAGEDFASLASQPSDSSSRHRGGATSPVTLDRLAPELAGTVATMAIGEISPVVELAAGFVVVHVTEVLPARTPTLDEVRPQLRAKLRSGRFSDEWQWLTTSGLAALDLKVGADAGPDPGAILATWRGPDGSRRHVRRLEVEIWARETGGSPPAAPADAGWTADRLRELAELEARSREAERRGILASDDYRILSSWSLLQLEAQLAANELARPWVTEPGEEALRAAFDADPERWAEPRRRRIQLLKAAIGPDLTMARYGELQALGRTASASCRDLAELAADLGAWIDVEDLGWLTDQQVWNLGRAVQVTVDGLDCGACSPLIQENRWLVVVRVVECRDPRRLELAEARPGIRAMMVAESQRAAGARVRREILDEQAPVLVEAAP